jgi:hypothetical protein
LQIAGPHCELRAVGALKRREKEKARRECRVLTYSHRHSYKERFLLIKRKMKNESKMLGMASPPANEL